MNLVDRIGERVVEAIVLAMVVLVAVTFANMSTRTLHPQSGSAHLLLFGLSNLGVIVTLSGLGMATWRAGPVGVFGFLCEFAGTLHVQNGELHLGLLLVGALLVVVGGLVWSWQWFFKLVTGGSGRSRRR